MYKRYRKIAVQEIFFEVLFFFKVQQMKFLNIKEEISLGLIRYFQISTYLLSFVVILSFINLLYS
jgi:hypothetical protein